MRFYLLQYTAHDFRRVLRLPAVRATADYSHRLTLDYARARREGQDSYTVMIQILVILKTSF